MCGAIAVQSMGSVCLGILNGTEAGLHTYNLIGGIYMIFSWMLQNSKTD